MIGMDFYYVTDKSNTKFKLKSINNNGFVYEFVCGKKVTDNVFKSMIKPFYGLQISLF
jgi:hypothetical protein